MDKNAFNKKTDDEPVRDQRLQISLNWYQDQGLPDKYECSKYILVKNKLINSNPSPIKYREVFIVNDLLPCKKMLIKLPASLLMQSLRIKLFC